MVEIKNIYGDVIYTAKDATTVKQAVEQAILSSANLSSALIDKKTIANLRQINVSSYPYQIQAVLFLDGSRWIRMGCLWKSLEDWKRDGGILNSNPSEFPNDRSEKSKERAAAFAFAKAAALRMKLPKGEAAR